MRIKPVSEWSQKALIAGMVCARVGQIVGICLILWSLA